jgi:hypothetical protein
MYFLCLQAVCAKCGVDTTNAHHHPLWLCKICSENREVCTHIVKKGEFGNVTVYICIVCNFNAAIQAIINEELKY